MTTNYGDKIKVIGFDLDQTLYPKSPGIDAAIQGYLYKKIAKHKGCSLVEAEKLFRDLYKEGRGLSGRKTLMELGVPNAEQLVQEALEKADIDKFLTPNKETVGVLNRLKERYGNMDLITGSDKNVANKKLKKLGMENMFSNIISADDASKSDGKAYELWLSFYPDLKSENFLYVGDRVSSDHETPSKLGIKTILVNVVEKDESVPCPQLKYFRDLETCL